MFKSILVPIDLADTDLAKPAIATAATLSQTWSGTVRLLNVLPMTPVMLAEYVPADFDEQQRETSEEALAIVARESGIDPARISTVVRQGGIYHEILEEAAQMKADLIVMTSHRPAMQKFMPMPGQDSFYTMASGGLGYSLPAAVGMALGKPKQRTVCLIGDGSAMYSIQALWTAAQRKLPLTVVVINNSGYGAMRSFSQVMQVRNVPGLELPGIDFVRLAEGVGCHAVRVTKAAELGEALKRSLAHEGTSLVEVVVDSAVPVLYGQKH